MGRIILGLLVCFILSACQLESEKPFIDLSSGEPLLGNRVALAAITEDGAFQHEKSGEVGILSMPFSDGAYLFNSQGNVRVSFHPVAGIDGLYLTQYVPKDGATIYLMARRSSDRLFVAPIDPDETTRYVLTRAGVTLEKKGSAYQVQTRADLNEVVRLWTQINLRTLERPDGFALQYLIEDGDGAGLQAQANAATCLALAGHPEDTAVQALAEKWRGGVMLDSIETDRALPVCQAAAVRGSSPSVRYALARVHEARKDYAAAERLLPQLLREEFPLAFVLAAEHRAFGNGVPKDAASARALLTGAAERGMTMPAYLLGMYELNGTLGQANRAAAQRWFEVATKAGIPDAHYQLGVLLDANSASQPAAYRHFRAASERGHVQATYRAGQALYFGKGIESDRKAAFRDLKSAAEEDVAGAQYFVGFMQARGQGTAKNETSAVGWLRKSHAAGLVSATGELGRMVYHGLGTSADPAEGKRLMERAAGQGDTNAKTYLAALKPATPKTAAQTYDVPRERAGDVNRLAEGKPFELTEANLPFMTGVASHLLERCKAPSDDFGRRSELAAFVASSTFGNIMGFDYSNPDLSQSLGSMGRSQSALIAGAVFAQQLPCGAVANRFNAGIANALRSNARGSDGGLSTFVKSCTPSFDQRRCACLANIGRQAIPNLHRQRYDRRLVREIINRNPMAGLQIAMVCQIGNY